MPFRLLTIFLLMLLFSCGEEPEAYDPANLPGSWTREWSEFALRNHDAKYRGNAASELPLTGRSGIYRYIFFPGGTGLNILSSRTDSAGLDSIPVKWSLNDRLLKLYQASTPQIFVYPADTLYYLIAAYNVVELSGEVMRLKLTDVLSSRDYFEYHVLYIKDK